MATTIHPLTKEQRDNWDKIEIELKTLIGCMEIDGDYGPEWAKLARDVVQEMQNFVYYDPRDIEKY